jgi:peptide/nickel transport system substrate-binding protein
MSPLPARVESLGRDRRTFLRLALGLGAATGLLAACGPSAPNAPAPTSVPQPTGPPAAAKPTTAAAPAAPAAAAQPTTAPGSTASTASGTLTIAQGADITTTDPFQIQAIRGMHTSMYDQLVVRDANFKIVPWLATSWENPDDTTWVFKLRQGVKFHNGEPFNAATVKWSFERFVAPETQNIYASFLQPVTDVEPVDDYTVRVRTKDPFPALIENLAYGVYMGPPDTMRQQGAEFFKNPVGTGPFRFVSWSPGEQLVVEATDSHFGGNPKIKRIVWKPVTETSTRVAQLRTGESDLITGVSPTQLSDLEGQSGIAVSKIPSQSFLVLIMNSGRPPFNDVRVRQAMNYAIDKQAIIRTLLGGNGTVLPAPAGPAHEGFDQQLGVTYNFDPEKAKSLLSEAGLGSGFSITLDTPEGRYLQDKAIAEAVGGMLTKVGVQVKVNPYEWGAFVKLLQEKTSDILLIQQGGSTTDALFPACFSSKVKGLPWLGYANPEADALIDKARATVNYDDRYKTYGELIKLLQQDAPWVYLHYQTNIFGVRDRVKGFVPRPDSEVIVQPMSVA